MTATRCVLLVARRELIERARSPMFVASMIITVLIVGVALIVPLMFQDNARKVGLVDAPDPVLAERVAAEAARAGLDVEVRMYGDVSSAEAAVAAGDVDAAVIADREVVWNAEPDLGLDAAITAALFETTVSSRAADLGVDPDTAAALVAPPDVTSRSLEAVDP